MCVFLIQSPNALLQLQQRKKNEHRRGAWSGSCYTSGQPLSTGQSQEVHNRLLLTLRAVWINSPALCQRFHPPLERNHQSIGTVLHAATSIHEPPRKQNAHFWRSPAASRKNPVTYVCSCFTIRSSMSVRTQHKHLGLLRSRHGPKLQMEKAALQVFRQSKDNRTFSR